MTDTPSNIIRLRDVIKKTGLSKTTIYRLAADPTSDFPAAVRLTPATVGWYESDIDAWVSSRKVTA